MTTDRDELMALIKRQPSMSAERFRQQVEEARRLSPSVDTLRVDSDTERKKNASGEKEITARP